MSKFKAGDEVVIVSHVHDSSTAYKIGDVDIIYIVDFSDPHQPYLLKGKRWWVAEECLELNNPQLENE